MARRYLVFTFVVATLACLHPATAQTCTGDCDGSGSVTVDEVVTGVNIALGSRPLSACTAFDSSNDQTVTVDEILQAVNAALDGCGGGAPTPTRTATPTATWTPPLEPGPFITYFGVAGASNNVLEPVGTDAQGRPIFEPTCRTGFFIVVEGRPNPNTGSVAVGNRTSNGDPQDPTVRPDFQLLASNDLGNGSATICDHRGGLNSQPPFGGIPGIAALDFDPGSQAVADALNDIGCRFTPRTILDPCTKSAFGNFRFVDLQSTIQFCPELTIDAFWALPLGETVFATQLRDASDRLGQRLEIVVRPANDCGTLP
jgi:hypothetical protein